MSQDSVESQANSVWGSEFDLFSPMDEDLLTHYTRNYYSTSRGATPLQRSRPATSEGASATSQMIDAGSIVSSLSGDEYSLEREMVPQVSPRTNFIGACIRDGIYRLLTHLLAHSLTHSL